jgi:Tfp pilus assembly protein PilF
VGGYTLGDVSRICGVAPGRLRYWRRMRLLEPRLRGRRGAAFEFDDLVSVRTLVSLLEQGVPLRRIRRSLESLRRTLPGVERPLVALRLSEASSDRVVVRHEGRLLQSDGQLVLDFAVAVGETSPVASLPAGGRGRPPQPDARDIAEEWFERGCQLDTDRATWPEAIEAYQRALEAAPDFADAHCNLGTVYYNQNRRSLARQCFERALDLEPGHVEAHLNLATVFEEDGRSESALRHYKLALEADPLAADTHVSLALLYEKLGLPGRARQHWRRYLQLDPDGTWADAARHHLDGPTRNE